MMKKLICFSLVLSWFSVSAQFTPGNLVIYRVGDGSAALTSAATPVFLDEYSPTGTLVQSIPIPTTTSGLNRRITASGTATSEGLITRSVDGQYVFLAGYDAAVGTASITGSTGAAINRIIGRIDANETLDATTAVTDFSSGGNPRSVVSTNGTDIWVSGSQGGVRYLTLGSTTSTQLSTTPTNIRQVNIFSGQLYASAQTGTTRLATVGTGAPITNGQTITNLPGFPTATGSPYGYYFADLDIATPGMDVVYVGDDGSSTGFQKYSLVAGSWVVNGNIAVTGNGLRSITASVSGNTVTLYGVNGSNLVKLTDATGYNATISGTVTVVAPAGTNTAFRGVAFAPVSAAAPTLTISSPLTAFGNVCINTTAGPNSFTISGTNLTTANVTVGALTGFTYSTNAGGTYATSLSLTQPGGTYTQEIFVKFDPTAVQSYNGNIPVAGGGFTGPVNAAASGAGVNTLSTVTSGAASAITSTTATVAGAISANGCSAVTAYGIEYSTTSGFANGTGTPLASTNLAAGNFSSDLAGLVAGTTYYYHAYATNGGGTAYGAELSFVTTASVPTLSATTLAPFGNVCTNASGGPNSFTLTGSNLSTVSININALPGFLYSTTSGGSYTATLNIPQSGGTFSQQIFVEFHPGLVQSFDGNILISGGGASSINVAASGAGIDPVPTLTTGGSSLITQTSATLAGTITNTGCTAISAYGIEYSTTSGFANGTGTPVAATNLVAGNFSSDLAGLAPATTYYYHAYAINTAGTGYGAEQTFTTVSPNPVITTTSLTAFGNVCINTTTAANSFTITGTNLTNADITVAALAGYSYSTTVGGTYTSSLTLTQTGGAYSQQVFVRFVPTAIQSYNGNIVINGGGISSPVNVAASGAGVNTIPLVTSGVASSITSISATVTGSITNTGCSAITAYGIEYSTTSGFANGTGTAVASTNLTGGNFTSALAGLNPATTYYYHAYATNAGGTGYGTEQSFITLSPSISTSALTAFGNVCTNTTAGPNSFTITGTNLTTANVTVAALAGYTYGTTAAGTYTTTLSLTQPGGAYSQQIFVRFTPTAIQSYNGNIVVNGGGISAPVNVAASGAGVNTAATVTTGAATIITQTTATTAGSITANGCSAITAYGIEYSTTNNFANGSGTQVASTNIAGGNFTSALTGLTPSTIHYYKAFATNSAGTTWGAQQSFTTAAPTLSVTSLTGFGDVCVNTTAGPNSFTITGVALSPVNVSIGALAGYTYSTTAGGAYTPSLSLVQPGGAYSQQIFVRFTPTLVQSYNGNIPVGGGAAATTNVAVTGNGINTLATVSTGGISTLTTHSVVAAGTLGVSGCSNITSYGIEYSGINGFVNGAGTKVAATNLTGTAFSSTLNGLVQGATYYYRAYATNNGGTSYGVQQSFTLPSIGLGLNIYPNPALRGKDVRVAIKNLTPGYYGLRFYNSDGSLVYQKDMNIQVGFINQNFTIPATLAKGLYRVQLVSHLKVIATESIYIL